MCKRPGWAPSDACRLQHYHAVYRLAFIDQPAFLLTTKPAPLHEKRGVGDGGCAPLATRHCSTHALKAEVLR